MNDDRDSALLERNPADQESLPPPLTYGLMAKVLLPRPAFGFRVEHDLPDNCTLIEAHPKATVVGSHLIWQIGRLDPGQELRLKITVQPEPGAKFSPTELASFTATYQQNLFFQTPVVRPKLSAKIDAPSQAAVGQSMAITVEVESVGNWPMEEAKAVVLLPPQLRGRDGRKLRYDLGELVPTDSRKLDIPAVVVAPGTDAIRIELTGADGSHLKFEHALECRVRSNSDDETIEENLKSEDGISPLKFG